MNSNIWESNRGRNIKPSARVSIHKNCATCHRRENMGKYGLGNKKSDINLPVQGVDDVDNVMSTTYSTIPNPHHRISRRHSSQVTDDPEDDDSDESILSKSSPASFLSSSETGNHTYISAVSFLDHSNSSTHNNSSRSGLNYGNLNNGTLQNTETTESNNSCSKLIYIFLPIFFCGLATIIYGHIRNNSLDINVYDEISFYNDVTYIGQKYKVLDNSILKVKTGISTIFEKKDTASFIFTYDSNVNNFNPLKFDQFVEDISAKSSKYLRNETKQVKHVVVNPSNLIVHTETEFMNQYQRDVDKRGVMLVKDVDSIPSRLAMAFHYYCDEYNPLVKKSAVFFTLNLANCSNGPNHRSTHEYIEKCLARKWNSIEQDKIGPLLTRVVNVVIDATSIW